MSEFYTLWTDTGLQQIGASVAQDKKFTMPAAVVGDGGGNPVIPTKGMTDLKSPVWEGPISSITQSRTDENTFVYEFAVPSDAGPFTVREVGLKDENGTLCIVGNFPDTPKPVAADGSVRDMVIRIPVHFENADSVSLTVDPLVVASNGDVDRKIAVHNEHGESHQDIREILADKTAQATEDKRGTAAIATQGEVDAGESAVKVIVPSRLKAWWESVRTWGNIKGKPLAFPPVQHTHTIDQVGLKAFVGMIGFFDCEVPPDGWLEANGGECPSYATALDTLIAKRHGQGSCGRSLLPDLRAEFVRGWDHGRGIDIGRELGSFQNFATEYHQHLLTNGSSHLHDVQPSEYQNFNSSLAYYNIKMNDSVGVWIGGTRYQTGNSGTETRSRNMAKLVCMYAGI